MNIYPYRKYIYINGKRLDLEAFISFMYKLWKEQKKIERKALTNDEESYQNSGGNKYYQPCELGTASSSAMLGKKRKRSGAK